MNHSHDIYVEWDEKKNRINQRKHKVSFGEAATVFRDPLEVVILDPDHPEAEDRFISIGQSSSQRLLVVSYAERADKIRIISPRRAIRAERKSYEETN